MTDTIDIKPVFDPRTGAVRSAKIIVRCEGAKEAATIQLRPTQVFPCTEQAVRVELRWLADALTNGKITGLPIKRGKR
jgi:hypothetical protein